MLENALLKSANNLDCFVKNLFLPFINIWTLFISVIEGIQLANGQMIAYSSNVSLKLPCRGALCRLFLFLCPALLTVFAKSNGLKTASTFATNSHDENSDPFHQIGNFLLRGRNTEFSQYTDTEIAKALQALASSQATLKSMDGATHQFRNTFSDRSSLNARFQSFIRGDQRNMKEAAKILEYVNTVERSLQSVEIVSASKLMDTEHRVGALMEAGLREIKRVTLTFNKLTCILSVATPIADPIFDSDEYWRIYDNNNLTIGGEKEDLAEENENHPQRQRYSEPRFLPGEIVVSLVDAYDADKSLPQLLRVMAQEPESIPLRSVGLVSEDVTLQPTLASLAALALKEIEEFLIPLVASAVDQGSDTGSTGDPEVSQAEDFNTGESTDSQQRESEITKQPKKNTKKQSKYSSKKGIKTVSLQGKKNNANTAQQHDHEGVFSAVYDRGNVQKVEPVEVRLKEPVSTGRVNVVETKNGTEAQLELNIDAAPAEPTVAINGSPLPRCVRIIGHSAGGAVGAYMAMVLEGSLHCSRGPLESVSGLVGLYKEPGLVRCVALGPPPCISRTIVPRFVTTVLCGDDIVPRAGPAALKHLRERAYKALKSGAGRSSLKWAASIGWLGDLGAVASKGLTQYAAGKHDLTSLSLPGRVFFLKSRQHKEGASIQRVLRGNWREDMLWLLHEILLTPKMIQHHSVQAYYKTLSRC